MLLLGYGGFIAVALFLLIQVSDMGADEVLRRRRLQATASSEVKGTIPVASPTEKGASSSSTSTYATADSVLVSKFARKFLVVEPEGGLGSRIAGIISSAFLAFIMDRVFVIDWRVTSNLPSTFGDLFHIVEASTPSAHNILYGESSVYDRTLPSNVQECTFDLSSKSNFMDFWILVELEIYKKMDAECDVIRIRTNQLFLELLENSSYGKKVLEASKIKYPYGHILRKILRPSKDIRNKILHFSKTSTTDGQWLSVHSRGALDQSSKNTISAIDCANHLLAEKKINRLFFSSDSSRINELFINRVAPYALITLERKYMNDSDTSNLEHMVERQNWVENAETSLEDWYLLGEADFCMTSTPHSLFSTTAMMRTGCLYIPYQLGGNCTAEVDVTVNSRFKKPKNMLVLDVKSMQENKVDVQQFWSSVKRVQVPIKFEAVHETNLASLRSFWLSDEKVFI